MKNILFLICVAASNPPAVGQETVPVVQYFDTDPGWDGFRNRLRPETMPAVRQDFGYQKTRFAGGSDVGEIGGVVQRAYRRAVCAKRIPVRTLNDSLMASGRFTVRDARGGSGVLIGWFNDETSQGWRTPDSLAMRIDGNDGKYWVFFEYGTTNRATGGGGAFEGERYQTTSTPPFLVDESSHDWTLSYDPDGANGSGLMMLNLDGESWQVPLRPGHKKLGATFDRFGIWNQQTAGDSLELYLDDLVIDGESESFDTDPQWDHQGNQDSYSERAVRPHHDFGFAFTRFTGGVPGEVGGFIFRDRQPAYYADRVGPWNLNSELRASGKLVFRSAGADSAVLLGWFNAERKRRKQTADHEAPQRDYLGVLIEGPSRVGHYFRAAYSTTAGNNDAPTFEGTARSRPVILPGDTVHHWTLRYHPQAANGRGQIAASLDGREHFLDLGDASKQEGANFDRFGLFNIQSGGHHVELYLDNVAYSK